MQPTNVETNDTENSHCETVKINSVLPMDTFYLEHTLQVYETAKN